ncbi:MAG: multiprotein bridging factor aMBF1 [Candidatus Altiarchaeota archaeon]
MQCELCGRGSLEAYKVVIEGSKVTACPECAKLGKIVERVNAKKKKPKPAPPKKEEKKVLMVESVKELSEDYAEKIRKARETAELRQDELARSINEPSSLIHRIESGKLAPSPSVAAKLERKLGVSLYEKRDDGDGGFKVKDVKGPVTLGDVVVVRKRQ